MRQGREVDSYKISDGIEQKGEGTDEKEESMELTRLHDVSAIEREGKGSWKLWKVFRDAVCTCMCVCGNKKENG